MTSDLILAVISLVAALTFGETGTGQPDEIAAFSVPRAVHPNRVNVMPQSQPSVLKGSFSRETIPNSVVLPPVTVASPARPRRGNPEPLKVGFNREIPATDAKLLDPAALIWSSAEGGRVTAVSVTSPGAVALRLAVAFTRLPAGAEVRFFGLDASRQVFGPITMQQIRALTIPARPGEPGVFWSPVVSGETVGMEIYVPNPAGAAEVAFTIPRLSHQYATQATSQKRRDDD